MPFVQIASPDSVSMGDCVPDSTTKPHASEKSLDKAPKLLYIIINHVRGLVLVQDTTIILNQR